MFFQRFCTCNPVHKNAVVVFLKGIIMNTSHRWTAMAVLFLAAGFIFQSCGGPGAEGGNEVSARLNDSPRHQEWVTIDTPHGTKLRAFMVFPETSVPALSVIVIHENRGLNDWVRSVADRLAEEGYAALAPDLLSGKGPDGGGADSFASGDDLRKALAELTPGEITANLKASVNYMRTLPSTSDKVAVAGFCWGGSNTFRFATNEPSLAGAFVFYGGPPGEEAMARIICPVFGFYGENDNRITSTVEQTGKIMTSLGKTYDTVIYPGAGHGFMRAGEEPDASEANKAAREQGWKRFLELLEKI